MICPVVNELSSEARKTAAPTISSSVPNRLHRGSHQEFLPTRGFEYFAIEFGGNNSRRDRVDADATLRPLDGERPGQSSDGGFAGAIGRDFLEGDECRQRSNIDDAAVAPFDHGFTEDLAGVKRAVQIHVHNTVPYFFGTVQCWHPLGDSGGVDENIDAPEGGDSRIVQFLQRASAQYLGRNSKGGAAHRFNFIREIIDGLLRAR